MGNLVPTARTDRNGRTQIRHMRLDLPPTTGALLPAPPQPAAAILPDSDQRIAREAREPWDEAEPGEHALEIVSLLRSDDRTMPGYTADLLDRGAECAQAAVRIVLRQIVDEIDSEYDDKDPLTGRWRRYCRTAWSPHSKNRLAAAWAIGDLCDKLGSRPHDDDLASAIHWARPFEDAFRDVWLGGGDDRSGENWRWYWLGIAALQQVKRAPGQWNVERPPDHERTEWVTFARHVGNADDPAALVRAALSSGTLNTVTLEHLRREQKDLAVPLHDGVL